ncbi:MAG TPA: (d)CMP kinase [Desulfatiglandales bacterium]|nr:(d)CMP kinase [Desulfatiglandales bacterium]
MSRIITIDGPTGSGKSTVSRLLAKKLKYRYLDTGAMYRVVGLAIRRAGVDLRNEKEVEKICKNLNISFINRGEEIRVYLENEDITEAIREPAMDLMTSSASAVSAVRKIMIELQRKIGSQGELVAEGRDMGTVVFPKAQHKFYLDALLEARVDRRFHERQKKGITISREKVKEDLIKRDYQDMNRSISPLRPAEDAEIVDTTGLDPQQVVENIINRIRAHKG